MALSREVTPLNALPPATTVQLFSGRGLVVGRNKQGGGRKPWWNGAVGETEDLEEIHARGTNKHENGWTMQRETSEE
jgi:hypothetical protein